MTPILYKQVFSERFVAYIITDITKSWWKRLVSKELQWCHKNSLLSKAFVQRHSQNLCPATHRAGRLKLHVLLWPGHVIEQKMSVSVSTLVHGQEYKSNSGNTRDCHWRVCIYYTTIWEDSLETSWRAITYFIDNEHQNVDFHLQVDFILQVYISLNLQVVIFR